MALRNIVLAAMAGCLCAAAAHSQMKASTGRVDPSRSAEDRTCESVDPGSNALSGPSRLKTLNELRAAAGARTAALIRRDADKLKQLLSPHFTYTNASGKVHDRESYIQNYALDKSVEWTSQELSGVCVTIAAGTAVLTAVVHDKARFGEYTLDARFRTTQVYVRSKAGWIYLAGHTSNIEAQP